jgi:membrane associated rhomboid family serine protease
MALTVLGLLIVVGVVFKMMTSEERERNLRNVITFLKEVKHALRERPEEQSFNTAIKERMPWPIVTPAILLLNIALFLVMVLGSGALGDPETIVGWGGSLGPLTTNGEWWRLETSLFVHSGWIQLFISILGLLQVGLLLEAFVGRFIFAATFLIAGTLASLVNLSAHQARVGYGASGAIFGAYGLLGACLIWSTFHRSSLAIPKTTLKRLVPAAVLFFLYSLASDSLSAAADVTALASGVICGLVTMVGTADPRPQTRRVSAVIAAAVVGAVLSAIPLRAIADVRPELDRLVSEEDRTVSIYQAADKKFRDRRITADALAELIDRTILPELHASDERLKAIRKVPPEHQHLVDDAETYVRLRAESWQLRAQGLRRIELRNFRSMGTGDLAADSDARRRAEAQHRANLAVMGSAEGRTRAALEVLQRIRSGKDKQVPGVHTAGS